MNALITGCSRGLGLGLLEIYLKQNEVKKVWAVSTNPDRMKALQAEFGSKLVVISAKVSEPACKGVISKALGSETLDLLINCAGALPDEPDDFTEISESSIQEGFDANTFSALFTTQACFQALQKSKNAKVISISSLMGSIGDNGSGGRYAYRMSKAALNMFSKNFAIENPKMISIAMHPGWVKTDMGGSAAPTTIPESVNGMAHVISKLTLKDSGQFFDFEGVQLEW